MDRLKYICMIAMLWVGLVFSACAAFDLQEIHVVSFAASKAPDRYTIVFDAVTADYGDLTNLSRKKRHFIVQLRCDPHFCTLAEYRTAIQLLRQRLADGVDFTIARMSGIGWRAVAGQRGMFETVGLRIPKRPNDRSGPVLFLHDDRF